MPGRCEPGTGEINYPAVARELARLGSAGTVGLEACASDDGDERALGRFRQAFTLPPEPAAARGGPKLSPPQRGHFT